MAKNAKMKYPIKTGFTIDNRNMAGGYRNGRPEGVLLHWNGNWKFPSIEDEIAYMTRNSINNGGGFTHAWSDDDEIIEIANTDYKCWGAGQYANARFAQIEALGIRDKDKAVASIDRALFWAAYQLYYYDLPCTDATKTGKGTVWTHLAATQFLGGTDHTDPIAYWESVGVTWSMAFGKLSEYYKALHAGDSTIVRGLHEKEEQKNHADNPDKDGRSTKFSRGEYVRTSKIATHFFQSGAIPADFHDSLLQVDWLNSDGTISVRKVLDAEGNTSGETYRMYERDLAYTDQNPKQHFSQADKPDKEGRSTLFAVGQKVRTSELATHYREGEEIEPWLHSQVLVVDYLNSDGSITVKPTIDTGERATFKRNLWEWDLTQA